MENFYTWSHNEVQTISGVKFDHSSATFSINLYFCRIKRKNCWWWLLSFMTCLEVISICIQGRPWDLYENFEYCQSLLRPSQTIGRRLTLEVVKFIVFLLDRPVHDFFCRKVMWLWLIIAHQINRMLRIMTYVCFSWTYVYALTITFPLDINSSSIIIIIKFCRTYFLM